MSAVWSETKLVNIVGNLMLKNWSKKSIMNWCVGTQGQDATRTRAAITTVQAFWAECEDEFSPAPITQEQPAFQCSKCGMNVNLTQLSLDAAHHITDDQVTVLLRCQDNRTCAWCDQDSWE